MRSSERFDGDCIRFWTTDGLYGETPLDDAAEGVVAAVAAAGGDDEVVFAAGDRVAEDDLGGDGVSFKDFRLLDDLRLVEAVERRICPLSNYHSVVYS